MMINRGGHSEEPMMAFKAAAATASSTLLSKPSGVAAGDFLAVILPDAAGVTLTTGGGGGAWTRDEITVAAHGYHTVLFARFMTATDIANSWTLSGAEDAVALAWTPDEVGSFAIRSPTANPTGQTQLILPGFTPANTLGVIAVAVDRDALGSMVVPSGFTSRYSGQVGAWAVGVADSDGYAGGNVVWNGMQAGFAESGWLVEVTFG